METLLALSGKGYVIVAADSNVDRFILKMKSDQDKIKVLGPHLLMAYSGSEGDSGQFTEYVERNIRLYQIRNLYPLRPSAAASWIRRAFAEALRKNHIQSDVLLAGYDTDSHEPQLYWIDNLGTQVKVPFAVHGWAGHIVLSLFDRYHDPEASLEEGLVVLKQCLDAISKRLIFPSNVFTVKVVDKDGVREVKL